MKERRDVEKQQANDDGEQARKEQPRLTLNRLTLKSGLRAGCVKDPACVGCTEC